MSQENIQKLPEEIKSRLRSDIQINTITQCISELVFNSLDAKSNSIAIRLNILTYRIQIIDNGDGITLENFENIGTRYMTNKCLSLDKFESKRKTYGFKGESLASIINVSKKVQVASRNGENETYLKTFLNGKAEDEVVKIKNRPSKGTTVTIEDFLYNYPVRQKRINKIDLNSIKNVLERLTIIFPNVSFSLKNEENDEVILNSHKEFSVSHVLCTLNNNLDIKKFSEFKVVKDNIKVSGVFYMTSTSIKNMQYIFINKFPVISDGVQKIIKKSLYNKMEDIFLTKLAFPVYVINIQCPYSEVVINFDSTTFQAEFKSWRNIKRCLEKIISLYIKKYNKQNELNSQKMIEKTIEIDEEIIDNQENEIKKPRKRLGMKYTKEDFYSNKKAGLKNNKLRCIEKPKNKLNKTFECLGNINTRNNQKDQNDHKLFGLFDDHFDSQGMNLSPTFKKLKISEQPVEIDNEEEGKKLILDTFMKSLSLSQHVEDKSQNIDQIPFNKSINASRSTSSSKEDEEVPDDNSNIKQFKDVSLCLKVTPQDIQAKKRRIEMLNSAGTGLIEKKLKLQSQQELQCNPKTLISTSTSPIISYRTIACQTETPKENVLHKENDKRSDFSLISPLKNHDISFLNQFWDDEKINTEVKENENQVVTFENEKKFFGDLNLKQQKENSRDLIFSDQNLRDYQRFRRSKSKDEIFYENRKNDNEDLIFGDSNLKNAEGSRKNRSRDKIYENQKKIEINHENNRKINQKDALDFFNVKNEDLIFEDKLLKRERFRKNKSKELFVENRKIDYKNTNFFESNTELINLTQKELLFHKKSEHFCFEDQKKNESIFFHKTNKKIESEKRNNQNVKKHKSVETKLFFENSVQQKNFFDNENIGTDKTEIFFKSPDNHLINNTTFNSHYFQIIPKKPKLFQKSKETSKKNVELNTNNTLHDLTLCYFKKTKNEIDETNNNTSKFFNNLSFSEPNEVKKKTNKKKSTILDTSTFYFKTPIKKDSKTNNFLNPTNKNHLLTESEISFNLFKPNRVSSQKDAENKFKFDFFESLLFEIEDNKVIETSFSNELNVIDENNLMNDKKIEEESKKDNIFVMKKRIDFVPKGFSPILTKENVLNVTLSPNSKKNLNNFIVKSYEEELNLVKWTDYIDRENPKEFFDVLYNEKQKLIEKDIPSLKNIKNPVHFSKEIFNTTKIIGQLDRKFIVVISKNQLLLFDQHAVHERVRLEGLYQEYMIKSNSKYPKFKSIRSNKIIKINFDEEKLTILETYKNLFRDIGFEYEIYSTYILIKNIPECLHKKNMQDVNYQTDDFFCNFLETLLSEEIKILKETGGIRSNIPRLLQDVMSTEACRGAIKFGHQLTQDEGEKHIKMLSKCQLPFQCAHGRPTLYPILVLSPLLNGNSNINFKKINY